MTACMTRPTRRAAQPPGWYVDGETQPFRTGRLRRWAPASATTGRSIPSCAAASGRRGPYLLHAVGVPALPAGLQAHRARRVGPGFKDNERAPGRWTRSSSRPPSSWAPTRRIRSRRKGDPDDADSCERSAPAPRPRPRGRPGAEAADKLRVVTTTTDLKALTEAVGGDLVEVDVARPRQPEPARPGGPPEPDGQGPAGRPAGDQRPRAGSVGRGRRAGRQQSEGHARARPGASTPPRASRSSRCRPRRVDRSMGDVHPLGNPHYTPVPGWRPRSPPTSSRAWRASAPQHRARLRAATARSSWRG